MRRRRAALGVGLSLPVWGKERLPFFPSVFLFSALKRRTRVNYRPGAKYTYLALVTCFIQTASKRALFRVTRVGFNRLDVHHDGKSRKDRAVDPCNAQPRPIGRGVRPDAVQQKIPPRTRMWLMAGVGGRHWRRLGLAVLLLAALCEWKTALRAAAADASTSPKHASLTGASTEEIHRALRRLYDERDVVGLREAAEAVIDQRPEGALPRRSSLYDAPGRLMPHPYCSRTRPGAPQRAPVPRRGSVRARQSRQGGRRV